MLVSSWLLPVPVSDWSYWWNGRQTALWASLAKPVAVTGEQWRLLALCGSISQPRLSGCSPQLVSAAWKAINRRALSLLKSTYLLKAWRSICKWECLVTECMHTHTHTLTDVPPLYFTLKKHTQRHTQTGSSSQLPSDCRSKHSPQWSPSFSVLPFHTGPQPHTVC